MSDRVFFDTNILVYAHDSRDETKRTRSQELLFTSLRDGTGVISPQVLSEFFVTVTRKVAVPLPAEKVKREVVLLSALATVDMDATMIVRAIDLHQRWHLSYWDALIVAAAERANCSVIYSEDMADGQTYGEATVRNPYN